MDAQTLHCPDCGAPASIDATKCDHCGAQLATIACPSCFGMIFVGSKFCPHCGGRVQRTDDRPDQKRSCPRCQETLQSATIGSFKVDECPKCEGFWLNVETFNAVCTDREQQAAVLGGASPSPQPTGHPELTLDEVRYLPCPQCGTLMNRVNFAGRSGVVIDTCRGHGTWFDRDELQHIVEFIRSGGLEKAREQQIKQLEQAGQQSRPVVAGASIEPPSPSGGAYTSWREGWDMVDTIMLIGGAISRLFFK